MSRTSAGQGPTPLLSLAGFRKFTPAEYHRMGEAGIIVEGEPFELLEGYVVEKGMRGPTHEGAVRRITKRLPKFVPVDWVLQVQDAVAVGDSEPEPDAAIVRGDETSYDTRHPGAGDIGIIIEVSDSTLAFDRRDKGRIYARAGIPVYWVVNVADRQVEVYTDPQPGATPPAYAARTDYPPGQNVPIVLDGQVAATISAADLLP